MQKPLIRTITAILSNADFVRNQMVRLNNAEARSSRRDLKRASRGKMEGVAPSTPRRQQRAALQSGKCGHNFLFFNTEVNGLATKTIFPSSGRFAMTFLAAFVLVFSASGSDFAKELGETDNLCTDDKHEESIAACLALAERAPDADLRFEAVCKAAKCIRLHLRDSKRALELCAQAGPSPYDKACRAVIYQWTGNKTIVLEDLGEEDIAAWPEQLAGTGFSVRANAHYDNKDGPAAASDFARAFQFNRGFPKWSALQRLGDTYWKLLDDILVAEACYRKCMKECTGGWPGLQARLRLAELLVEEERFEAALQALEKSPHNTGYWKAAMVLQTAKVHAASGNREKALEALEETVQMHGVNERQLREVEKLKAELNDAAGA